MLSLLTGIWAKVAAGLAAVAGALPRKVPRSRAMGAVVAALDRAAHRQYDGRRRHRYGPHSGERPGNRAQGFAPSSRGTTGKTREQVNTGSINPPHRSSFSERFRKRYLAPGCCAV